MFFDIQVKQGLKSLQYHAYTMWLFVFSDIKTILLPSTICGVTNALAANEYNLPFGKTPLQSLGLNDMPKFAMRILLTLLWVVINFLPFAINNQRGERAIVEDTINKSWRPFPSQRISHKWGTRLMIALYIMSLVYSLRVGGIRDSVALMFISAWYNSWGGANDNPVVRSAIIAVGYASSISGATEVALGGTALAILPQGVLGQWLLMLTGIVFSTSQLQDLSDQPGDAKRGRRTAPLVWGDGIARWTVALPMVVWGVWCPMFWGLSLWWSMLIGTLAFVIAVRTLLIRDVQGDKKSFRLWNVWIALIYVLPLASKASSS